MSAEMTRLQDEAARWVARTDRQDWSDADEAELAIWLQAHPRAQGELLRAQAAWAALDMGNIVVPARFAEKRRTPLLRRRTLMAGAAAAMAASVAGLLVYAGSAQRYDTDVGEIRRVALADGSTAAINTDSSIAVEYDRRLRRIRLDKGEAWFQVKHDRARPFLVEAGDVRVRAVGTAFSVRRREGGADIIVTEGVVAAWTDENASEPVSAKAGMHLFVPDRATALHPIALAPASSSALSWRNGQIELVARPLQDAAAEFNRYNRRQIVIDDPAIAQERVDGIFRTDDPEGFATAVQHILGVPLEMADGGEIVIGRK